VTRSANWSTGNTVSLVVLTLGGLTLRLYQLDAFGIWFDEAYHVALVGEPSSGAMLDAVLSNPPSNPLYVLVLRAWTELVGTSDAFIRLPSVVFGSATVPATAWLAVALGMAPRQSLLAAAFVAVSPYALEFSQEAAPYALAALAPTVAIAAAWRWRSTGSPAAAMGFVLAGVIAVYSHYVVFAILALTGVLGVLPWAGSSRASPRAWLAAHAAIALAWLPWAIASLVHWANSEAPRVMLRSPVTLEAVAGAATQYAAGTSVLLAGARPLQGAAVVLGAILLGLGWRVGGDPARRGLRVVLIVAALIFLVPAGVAAVTGAWLFVAHFMLLLLPALLIVAAAGAASLSGRAGPLDGRLVGAALATGWLAVEIAGTVWYFAEPPHGDDGLRELVATIQAHLDDPPADPILVAPSILEPALAHYLRRPLTGIPRPFDLRDVYGPFVTPPSDQDLAAATDAAAAGAPIVWLVHRPELDPREVVPTTLRTRYTLQAEVRTEFATLMRFERQAGARP
jgi:hypothetical protein